MKILNMDIVKNFDENVKENYITDVFVKTLDNIDSKFSRQKQKE